MSETLLQVAHEAHNVSEFTFYLKDVVILMGGVVTISGVYLKLMLKIKGLEDANTILKEDVISASRGRHATKKECFEKIAENHEVVMNRIDKTQADLKDYTKETNAEFKSINENLHKILGLLEK